MEEELQEILERSFHADGEPLDNVMSIIYLVWVLTVGDDNWSEVTGNLQKLRISWVRILRVLSH